jgi:dTDP-4-amino-4,6-dideoxygalactose transaminase
VELGLGGGGFPVTDRLCQQVLSIPVHPDLSEDEVDTVIGAVNEVAAKLGSPAGEGVR